VAIHTFCLTVADAPRDFDTLFYACGGSDATVGVFQGFTTIHFAREASSLTSAIKSGRDDVKAAGGRVVLLSEVPWAVEGGGQNVK
jgi:hypothetical protein